MNLLIVTSLKIEEKPEHYFPHNPLVKYLKDNGDNVSIFHTENDDIYLADYITNNNESLFQEVDKNRVYERLNNIDVVYITSPSKLGAMVLKICLELNIPVVAEYYDAQTKDKKKLLYKAFFKHVTAIHFENKETKEEYECLINRRVNAHIFNEDIGEEQYLKTMRNMILTYSNNELHNNNRKLFYSDEINDDFSVIKIKVKKGKRPFKYVHKNPFWRFFEMLIYRVIAKPLVFFINKIYFHQRIKNKRILRRFRKKGYFIYSNHTNGVADAFTPNILSRKRNYIVVSKETVSIKGLKGIVTMLGAIPIYADIDEVEAFNDCIKKRIKQNRSVTIYPEAHIWPYYTKIRHFKKDSFRYPVDLNVPVYVLTNTWQKRHFSKRPKLVSYLSGPIFPSESLSRNEAMEDLKERVYFEMVKITRSIKQIEPIQYFKVEK